MEFAVQRHAPIVPFVCKLRTRATPLFRRSLASSTSSCIITESTPHITLVPPCVFHAVVAAILGICVGILVVDTNNDLIPLAAYPPCVLSSKIDEENGSSDIADAYIHTTSYSVQLLIRCERTITYRIIPCGRVYQGA